MSTTGKDGLIKVWCISDTHCNHRGLEMPHDIDMVIHAGDATNSMQVGTNAAEIDDFIEWFNDLPLQREAKFFTPGNHDTSWEAGMFLAEKVRFSPAVHSGTETPQGLTLFGSPYTPRFHDWAYMKKRNKMDKAWQSVPEVDILVTHGPPQMIMDLTRDREGSGLISVGCKSLWNHATKRIKPKLHVFGHIHDEPGIRNAGILDIGTGTTFVNASCCDIRGNLVRNGFVVEIPCNE